MDLKKLEYFCSVANHLSFSKAAEECRIAQPAMSRIISSLEEELGFQLFYRNRRNIELTDAGRSFLVFTVKLISDYSMAALTCKDIATGRSSRLTIGCGGFDISFIRQYLPDFIKMHPEYSIILRSYTYDDIVGALTSKECDVIFAPNSRIGKLPSVRRIVTSSYDNKIAVGKEHRLYGRTDILPEEVDGETFICAYDTIHSWNQLKQFERTCSIYGINPGRRLHTNTASALLTMVELGLGIAFLTDNVDVLGRDMQLLKIQCPSRVMKVHVAACFTDTENPAVAEFMDYLEKCVKEKKLQP